MEAVGRLTSGIAHDFNNLLTPILGYSEDLALQIGESNDLYPEIAEIRKAGERAAALTRRLLAFSRQQVLSTESPRLELHREGHGNVAPTGSSARTWSWRPSWIPISTTSKRIQGRSSRCS